VPQCGAIHYQNPRMVVGCIIEEDGKLLLCKRAIEPRHGYWTVPAGFLELGESTVQGAARETLEEAGARVQITAPYAHFDIPHIGQAYVFYLAKLITPEYNAACRRTGCFARRSRPLASRANLLMKFEPESWQRAVGIFRDAIEEYPSFSPCYSSLVQMNNIEHIVHPGLFRDLSKARATLDLAK